MDAGRGRVLLLADAPGTDGTALAASAAEAGVGITPGALFYSDGSGAENVRLSFSMVDEALIDDGVERLAGLVY